MTSQLTGTGDITPRLLNLRQAAAYCGVSFWSLRDWCIAGYLPTVDLPPLRPREGDRPKRSLRRVLVDREDLDRFIEQRKSASHFPAGGDRE